MLEQRAGVAPAVWGLSLPRYDCIAVCATGRPAAKNKRRNKMEYARPRG